MATLRRYLIAALVGAAIAFPLAHALADSDDCREDEVSWWVDDDTRSCLPLDSITTTR